jgi:hypothetical protein
MPSKETFEPKTELQQQEKAWIDARPSVREQIHYIDESASMNEHQREMSFLRHLMIYDETTERHELEETVTQAQGHERCARRAAWLMVLLTAVAVAGLAYSALLLEDFPPNSSQFVVRIFCALALASVVSLLVFVGFWIVSRGKLNDQRDKCRRLVTRIVESRLGKPAVVSSPELVRTRSRHNRVAAGERPGSDAGSG